MASLTPEQNAAIATLQQACASYSLLKDAIAAEHEYCYDSMKLELERDRFMIHYGGYIATKNLLSSIPGARTLELTDEMCEIISENG